jgi:uncharacterized protein (DUF1778 family)
MAKARRTEKLHVLVTPAEHQAIRLGAAERGSTVADYVRRAAVRPDLLEQAATRRCSDTRALSCRGDLDVFPLRSCLPEQASD